MQTIWSAGTDRDKRKKIEDLIFEAKGVRNDLEIEVCL